jgi:hypothetical protein
VALDSASWADRVALDCELLTVDYY